MGRRRPSTDRSSRRTAGLFFDRNLAEPRRRCPRTAASSPGRRSTSPSPASVWTTPTRSSIWSSPPAFPPGRGADPGGEPALPAVRGGPALESPRALPAPRNPRPRPRSSSGGHRRQHPGAERTLRGAGGQSPGNDLSRHRLGVLRRSRGLDRGRPRALLLPPRPARLQPRRVGLLRSEDPVDAGVHHRNRSHSSRAT